MRVSRVYCEIGESLWESKKNIWGFDLKQAFKIVSWNAAAAEKSNFVHDSIEF